jgi:hypothetical protein
MNRARNILVLAAVGALSALAACGGKESAPPPTPAPSATGRSLPMALPSIAVSLDACQLLTRQEVEAALGTPVGDPPQATGTACRWAARSGPDAAMVTVIVHESPAQARKAFQKAVEVNGYKTVSGLGDGAYSSPMYDLTVLSGKYELAVDVSLLADEAGPVARKLAAQAGKRLPR